MSFNHHHHHQQRERPYVEEEWCEGERLYGRRPECGYERVDSAFYEESPGGVRRHNYKRDERLGELGAVAAGAFAVYEANKVKTDPCHANRHKREEEAAALGALGSAGYGYYEHREKEKFEDGRRW